jgi:hypothetical protein
MSPTISTAAARRVKENPLAKSDLYGIEKFTYVRKKTVISVLKASH